MGLNISCFDNQRIPTVQDTGMGRSYTDDELTVFLANASFIFDGQKSLRDTQRTLREAQVRVMLTNLIIPDSGSLETDSTPKLQPTSYGSPLPQSKCAESPRKPQTRIFSSNAIKSSINIIERIHKNPSHCSTNVNSKSTSRCVSPISKTKSTIIE